MFTNVLAIVISFILAGGLSFILTFCWDDNK